MAYTYKHGDRPVDGYTIQRAVGRGGFGEVYYAVSDGGREVAIKYLRDNPQVELRGVSHCINLKSPHLVSIFDVKKTTEGEYAIIMEYCSGPSLRDLLVAEPSGFPAQKAAFFLCEAAKGLAYLHDRGIVHRDLKPGNLFFDDGYVKIGDYGLSKFISVSRHSAQTASVGTVHYMAPEIGSGDYSRGVDIYALGVILYEMLLGKVPFEGSTMAEVLMKHLTAQPELDALPQPFGKVVRRALQKDPADRYQSVDEMVSELLEVEEVKQSLAGFRPQSLEGAVCGRGLEPFDSPIPSPNPPQGLAPGFRRGGAPPASPPPFAQPIQPGSAFPDRLAKRMDRASSKIGAKMARLANRGPQGAAGPGSPAVPREPAGGSAPPFVLPDRKKRVLLVGLLSIGLAVGLGILIGNTQGEAQGVAAGLLVFVMSGGVLLSRKAVRWFGAEYGPKWTKQLIQLCCCAPLLAIGAAPLFDLRSNEGAAVYLGLLFCAVFCDVGGKREKLFERGGEISFGPALWAAFVALICTAIAGAIVDADVEGAMFISAGVTGAVYMIVQANMWWLPAPGAPAFDKPGPGSRESGEGELPPPPPPPVRVEPPDQRLTEEPFAPTGGADAASGAVSRTPRPRLRWGITRAFWGLTTFVLMGGALVTFLIPLLTRDFHYHDVTLAIVLCTGFASFVIFALRKTTPIKRHGFWRESLRPFLISLMMFGMGGTITGIAREWDHWVSSGYEQALRVRCLPDEARVALVAGLVLCSLLFLVLLASAVWQRKRRKPFLQDGTPTYDIGETNNVARNPADAKT